VKSIRKQFGIKQEHAEAQEEAESHLCVNNLNLIRLLMFIVLSIIFIRNFDNTTLIVELIIPSGIIYVHELTITQQHIITILMSFNGLLHFTPSSRRADNIMLSVSIHILIQL
jgi:hypothetical protein